MLAFYSWYHIRNRREGSGVSWKYWIYLTDWGYELLIWKLVLEFALVAARFSSETYYAEEFERVGRKRFWHETNHLGNQFLWLMTTVSHALAVAITIAYWTCLYPFEPHSTSVETNFININQHGVQGLVSVLDTLISGHPKRLAHVWAPALLGLAYLVFNVAYTLTGGTDPSGNHWIYPITDWLGAPVTSSLFAVGIFLMLFLVHLGLWALAKARDKIWTKHFNGGQREHGSGPAAAAPAAIESVDDDNDETLYGAIKY